MAGGDLPHLGLGQLGEREAQPPEQVGGQRRQHVALILGLVDRRGEQRPVAVVDDPRVVAGDEMGGAEPIGQVDHRRDPHLAVAKDAGIRRIPRRVAGDEPADDAAAKFLLEVEGEVGDAERVGERAGAKHRLRGAAGLGAVGLGISPELHRHADHLRPALALQQRGDGAVDPARHRRPGPGRSPGAASRADEAAALASARCSASAASWAAWRFAGVSPPIAASTSVGRRSARRRGRSRHRPAQRPPRLRPASPRIPPCRRSHRRSSPPSSTSEIRDRSPQAAPPAAPVKAPSGAGPSRLRSPRYCSNSLSAHRQG